MLWTIASLGVEKLVADWGLKDLHRALVNQGIDTLSFVADGAATDAAPLFPYKSNLTLWRDRQIDSSGNFTGGATWFQGLITQIPRAGSPDAESMQYKISGPWWYLDNLVFQMAYQNILLGTSSAGPFTLGPGKSTHTFLNLDPAAPVTTLDGVKIVGRLTTGEQIVVALDYCLAPFLANSVTPPFQIGRITPAVEVPIDEVRDITCAEVIHKMLRWTPDAVAYFDYTTQPPTFNVLRRADMTTVNIDVSNT